MYELMYALIYELIYKLMYGFIYTPFTGSVLGDDMLPTASFFKPIYLAGHPEYCPFLY